MQTLEVAGDSEGEEMKCKTDYVGSAFISLGCGALCYIIVMYSIMIMKEKKEKNIKIAPIVQKEKVHEVFATRIGLIGNTTYSGLVVKSDSVFVALPSKEVQRKYVKVTYKGSYVICQVMDLGPWSRNDPYWETEKKPKAEGKIADSNINSGVAKNKAGIDLSDGLWDKLGIKRGLGITKVKWSFVEKNIKYNANNGVN